MSLEAAILKNNELIAEQNRLLALVIGGAGATKPTESAASKADNDDGADTGGVRERGQPAPGKSRRTAAEVAEDKAADEAEAAAAAGGGTHPDAVDNKAAFAALRENLSKWLGEFAKPEDKANPEGAHPEVPARRNALRARLNAVSGDDTGAFTIAMLEENADYTAAMSDWFETKAKTVQRGFGVGRLAADPTPPAAAADTMADI